MDNREFSELYGRYIDTSSIENKRLDICYGNKPKNRMDVYYPDLYLDKYPAIVFIHGGAFFKGDKKRYQLKPALQGLKYGYAVISIDYSLAPEELLPQAYIDVRKAVNFIIENSEMLKIDKERICLWGESVGASLALYTAIVDEMPFDRSSPFPVIQAIIDWYAPIDLIEAEDRLKKVGGQDRSEGSLYEVLFGKKADQLHRAMEELDPTCYLKDAVIPPVLIEHGDKDPVVDLSQSIHFREELLKYLPEEQAPMRIVEGAGHGVEYFQEQENLDYVFKFIQRYV
ncbi:MAG: alpha/beta hydrolase [Erysipelotrichaceae bacterium]|nr:alpha/beta hydrolase [Erysipelotrichaceae bacterium]